MNIDDLIEKNYRIGSYFIVPRDLVDGTYPKDYLSLEDKLLMLLILHYRDESRASKLGKVTIGVQAYDKHIRPIRNKGKGAKAELEKAIRPLVTKGFLFPINAPTQSLQYAIALPPLYDPISKTPLQRFVGEEYSNKIIKKKKLPYIRVPDRLIDSNIITPRNSNLTLNNNHLDVLLFCYSHNWLEAFGGVDMKFIRKENGKLKINPRVYMNLHINTDADKCEFRDALTHLEKMGLIIWVDIVTEKNVFVCDANLFDPNKLTAKHRIIKIIRPIFQPSLMKEDNQP